MSYKKRAKRICGGPLENKKKENEIKYIYSQTVWSWFQFLKEICLLSLSSSLLSFGDGLVRSSLGNTCTSLPKMSINALFCAAPHSTTLFCFSLTMVTHDLDMLFQKFPYSCISEYFQSYIIQIHHSYHDTIFIWLTRF